MTSSLEAPPQVAIDDLGSPEAFLAAIDATIKYFNDGDIVEGTIVKVDRDEGCSTSATRRGSHPSQDSPSRRVDFRVRSVAMRSSPVLRRDRRARDPVKSALSTAGTIEKIKESAASSPPRHRGRQGGLIIDSLRGFRRVAGGMRRVRAAPYVGMELEANISS